MALIKATFPDRATSPDRAPNQHAERLCLRIDGDSQAAGRARHEITRLSSLVDPPLLEDMRLLVSELVSNSVRHAGASEVELTVAVSSEKVHVEVANAGARFRSPTPGQVRRDTDPGWGLFLVDRLSHDWGVLSDGGHQRVWFEFDRA